MEITFDRKTIASYMQFLQLRQSPVYHWKGSAAVVPDEYASSFGMKAKRRKASYDPCSKCFDYQRDIVGIAIRKKKYAIFADCGLGKTLMIL